MTTRLRLSLFVLVLLLFIFVGILFSSYLYDFVVTPVAVLLLLLWRIAQSVDQAMYWGALIAAASFYFLLRIYGQLLKAMTEEPFSSPGYSDALEDVRYWRRSILLSRDENLDLNSFRRDLRQMVAALYASKQTDSQLAAILEALAQRPSTLPEAVHAFLFPPEPKPERSIRKLVHQVRQAPGRWILRWSGRDLAEYHYSIDLVLNLLESSLEINNDDQSIQRPHA